MKTRFERKLDEMAAFGATRRAKRRTTEYHLFAKPDFDFRQNFVLLEIIFTFTHFLNDSPEIL